MSLLNPFKNYARCCPNPIQGYALADCREILGDHVDRVVAWKGGSDVSGLAGRPVRLRFAMKDADLHSLRFR
jgi:hypothetical protein